MYGSLSAGFPHVVEPDCPAGSRVWSDLLLQRSNRSEYLHGRYAWIRGTSSRPHPSRFLHLEHTSSGGPSTPRATCIPMILASHGEGLLTEGCYRQAGSGAESYGAAGFNITGSSDGATLAPATPILWESASNPIPAGVQPPSKPKGRGVTFDSSTDKLAATGGQDTDGHRRQRTQGRDDNTQPTSPAKGACKRSSIRMTGKQMLHQVSECPSGAPHEALTDSTPGSTSCQCSSSTRDPRDPLDRVAHYRSQGWRKDLDLIFKAYYKYNFYSFKESEWSKLRDKVLDHLLPCQDEWRSIKEKDPLQYMPYMEKQFYAATRIRLKGLAECTRWIKQGSYYHSVVAKKGQLHKCPHLAGKELPRGPQITPSESHRASQKKAEAFWALAGSYG